MAHLLGAEGLGLEYPTKVVFESLTLGVGEGDRIGIVGRNGDGKSSLLGMLSGRIDPDSGRVTRRSGLRVGVLDQADALDDSLTVGRAIAGERREHEWAGDRRTRDVIAGLVPDLDWQAGLSALSGGQRRRVALAALLVGDWDVLMLDEPTNHLDVQGIAWLARHLGGRWPAGAGGLLVVTHDRWFLDEVATSMWEVHDRTVEPFEGGYAAYVLQRLERDRIAAAAQAAPAHALPIAADAREHTAGSSRPTAVDRTSSLDLLSSSPRVRRRTVIVAMKAARSRQNSSGRVARIAPMRGFGPSSP